LSFSVVPPRPPAIATVRSYWTLAEPNENRCRRLALAAGALVFVAAVGLGPFPGVLAVVAYTTTSLAKLYGEAVEGIDPGPVDAITATGATRLQILRFGVLPQVLPLFLSYVLYRLETNIRVRRPCSASSARAASASTCRPISARSTTPPPRPCSW